MTPKKLEMPMNKKHPKTYMLRVRIPYEEFLYLAELSLKRGITLSEQVRLTLHAFRIMMDLGLADILKPVPELEKIVEEKIVAKEAKIHLNGA
jgi:hypothetical protein